MVRRPKQAAAFAISRVLAAQREAKAAKKGPVLPPRSGAVRRKRSLRGRTKRTLRRPLTNSNPVRAIAPIRGKLGVVHVARRLQACSTRRQRNFRRHTFSTRFMRKLVFPVAGPLSLNSVLNNRAVRRGLYRHLNREAQVGVKRVTRPLSYTQALRLRQVRKHQRLRDRVSVTSSRRARPVRRGRTKSFGSAFVRAVRKHRAAAARALRMRRIVRARRRLAKRSAITALVRGRLMKPFTQSKLASCVAANRFLKRQLVRARRAKLRMKGKRARGRLANVFPRGQLVKGRLPKSRRKNKLLRGRPTKRSLQSKQLKSVSARGLTQSKPTKGLPAKVHVLGRRDHQQQGKASAQRRPAKISPAGVYPQKRDSLRRLQKASTRNSRRHTRRKKILRVRSCASAKQ